MPGRILFWISVLLTVCGGYGLVVSLIDHSIQSEILAFVVLIYAESMRITLRVDKAIDEIRRR
jgi:hypothetical protein